MSRSGGADADTLRRRSYGDPVTYYIRGVYHEYMNRWSYGQERDTGDQNHEHLGHAKGLPVPATTTFEVKNTAIESPEEDATPPIHDDSTHQEVDSSIAAVAEPDRVPSKGQASLSDQHMSVLDMDHDSTQTTDYLVDEDDHNTKLVSDAHDLDMIEVTVTPAQSSETVTFLTEKTKDSAPMEDLRCLSCWHDSIPCHHDHHAAITRAEYLRRQRSKPQGKLKSAHSHATRSQTKDTQQVEQQQRESRLRDRRRKEQEAQSIDDGSTQRKERAAKRQQSKAQFGDNSIEGDVPQADPEEKVVQRPRRNAPQTVTVKPTRHSRTASGEMTASTSALALTPTTPKRNTAISKSPVIDPKEEERARIKRRQERKATERAIIEQHEASLRAQETKIKKCYYCWHYSQPCNPKMKPKCIPCHKNRRSCFGAYTRPEFCEAYKERTGKVHKQAQKDYVRPRQSTQRKGHYNHNYNTHRSDRGRHPTIPSTSQRQPRRVVFLDDSQRKCYRCWDRSLACDLKTPKCGSCDKGRAACFGFACDRREFCEIFEEETGEKHRWAALFETGGADTTQSRVIPFTPRSSTTSTTINSTKKRSRSNIYEDETSETSGDEGWNSELSDIEDDSNDDDNDTDSDSYSG